MVFYGFHPLPLLSLTLPVGVDTSETLPSVAIIVSEVQDLDFSLMLPVVGLGVLPMSPPRSVSIYYTGQSLNPPTLPRPELLGAFTGKGFKEFYGGSLPYLLSFTEDLPGATTPRSHWTLLKLGAM